MTTDQDLLREELTEDQHRDRKIEHMATGITNGAYLLCKKAGLPIRIWGGRRILGLDRCWDPEPHIISTESDCPDGERMRLLDKTVLCPIHQTHFSVRQILDLLPLGKRKSVANKDALLATINWDPEPTRRYVFESGEGVGLTLSINTDPVLALAEAHPTPKQLLRGVVTEVADLARVRELIETKGDDLPWRSDLAGMLRDDLSLSPSWHGASLSEREKMLMHQQQLETAVVKRKARMKLIGQMRSDADRLVVEPL
jgi:hypothetical protein